MKVILLGKGDSLNKINKEFILCHDVIAWANIHNHIKFGDLIPSKVDYLFLREKIFIDDLTKKQKTELNNLDIKHVLMTGISAKNIKSVLKYSVEKHIYPIIDGFNLPTGLLALNYLVGLSPEIITIVGIDLFKPNENLYYFKNVDDSLSSKKNNKSLKSVTVNGKLKEEMHEPEKQSIYIKNIIENNKNIKFQFCTINKELKKEISDYTNVKIVYD